MLLVQAGKPVDDFIQMIIPFLDKGDIIIDGGNSLYKDSMVRETRTIDCSLSFVCLFVCLETCRGIGKQRISLHRYRSLRWRRRCSIWSITDARRKWQSLVNRSLSSSSPCLDEIFSREHVKPIFQTIAAKADGQPCCDWVRSRLTFSSLLWSSDLCRSVHRVRVISWKWFTMASNTEICNWSVKSIKSWKMSWRCPMMRSLM